MALKHSYSLLAPVYDLLVEKPLQQVRVKSLSRLQQTSDHRILVNGIGTGLDIPHLPNNTRYVGTDITRAMLDKAQRRAEESGCDIELIQADSMSLPFEDNSFDHMIMHLILAVVPNPHKAIREACRVLKPGGRILLLDKFLKPGELALIRRMLNLLTRHIATRTDVVFEDVISETPELVVVSDEPALAGGWFRLIELQKNG